MSVDSSFDLAPLSGARREQQLLTWRMAQSDAYCSGNPIDSARWITVFLVAVNLSTG
jgi:hypothetical protein